MQTRFIQAIVGGRQADFIEKLIRFVKRALGLQNRAQKGLE